MTTDAIVPSQAPKPGNGHHVIDSEEEVMVVGTTIYSHPCRGPMYLEFGDKGTLRCTSIVWHEGAFRLRRTKFCDGKYRQYKEQGMDKMQLTFSCRLRPTMFPTIIFKWKADQEIWINSEIISMRSNKSHPSSSRFLHYIA